MPHVAVPNTGEVVCQLDDIWTLGAHRILCGDNRIAENLTRLFDGERTRTVITDPPYNVPIAGHVSGLGQHHHGEFVMGAGEMSPAQFSDFLLASLKNMARWVLRGWCVAVLLHGLAACSGSIRQLREQIG